MVAAVALIDAEGIGQLTMRRLGAAIGVEAMALYRYFPSRRALLDALVESVINLLDDLASYRSTGHTGQLDLPTNDQSSSSPDTRARPCVGGRRW